MKKTLLILATLATATAPMTLRADSNVPLVKKPLVHKTITVSRAPKVLRPDVEYIYVTRQKVTGSNIPMVVRRYNGRLESTTPTDVLTSVDIAKTGSEDLAGALVRRDPALTYRR